MNEQKFTAEELLRLTKTGTNAKGRKWPWVQLKQVGDSAQFDCREYELEKVKRAANMHGYTYNCRFEFKFEHPFLTVIRVPHTTQEIEAVELALIRQKRFEERLEAEATRNAEQDPT